MILGDSMAPKFERGDIIIEPDAQAHDGPFVLARSGGPWLLRPLRREQGRWCRCAREPRFDRVALPDREWIGGVVVPKSRPARRGASRRYIE
jgi:SOS-response transcriptional repressor LexA